MNFLGKNPRIFYPITLMSVATIGALSLAEIVGDFGFKDFARTGTAQSFAQGSAGYVAVVYLLIKALKSGNVLYVNGMWDGVSAALESVAAFLILGERLETPMQYGGLVIIILGIFMLHSGGIPY
jgi:multidrug transporter EmrE-like cation transporter